MKNIAASLFFFIISFSAVRADMVRNDSIGSDPAKEQLCTVRAKTAGNRVPFEIDSRYLASARSQHADVTFIAIDNPIIGPTLFECFLREGTGRFEPEMEAPPQWFWHMFEPNKPEQFKPGLNDPVGKVMAANACLKVAPEKINRPNYDHSVYFIVGEAGRRPLIIGGKKAEPYDITVNGRAFYGPAAPDWPQ